MFYFLLGLFMWMCVMSHSCCWGIKIKEKQLYTRKKNVMTFNSFKFHIAVDTQYRYMDTHWYLKNIDMYVGWIRSYQFSRLNYLTIIAKTNGRREILPYRAFLDKFRDLDDCKLMNQEARIASQLGVLSIPKFTLYFVHIPSVRFEITIVFYLPKHHF